MTITEVLQFVDRLVEKQRGKHLNDLEKAVVQGLWQGKSYSQIADECGYDKNYIGDVSRQLFKDLSEQLDEKITRANFCWTIERVINSQFVGLVNSNITWCAPHPQPNPNPSIADEEETNKKTGYRDLAIAPSIAHFCDRTTELQTLSDWVVAQNTRLISVLGLPGIGKTTLVKRFLDLNLEAFDVVVWKSLKFSRCLDSTVADILTATNFDNIITENTFTRFFNLLRQQRCLLIWDDVQELFIPGELTGQYKREYQNYKTLFTQLKEIEHQSCVILLSQEHCQEMLDVNDERSPAKSLELKGLNVTDFLKPLGLSDENSWSRLMEAYDGHPIYLKDVASLINNVFGGKVSEFLAEDGPILPADTQLQLREMLKRLSPIEEQIILKLSESYGSMSREELRQSLDLSLMEMINGLQSLNRRYLLKTVEKEMVLFDVSGVVREYFRMNRDK